MFAILDPFQPHGDNHLHRVAKIHKDQTHWIPIERRGQKRTEEDMAMNMAICYYMDDTIRRKNEIGDWSDDLTIGCIEPGYKPGEKYNYSEYLDNDHLLLAVHLQMCKISPQDTTQDQECYYSLVIKRGGTGASGVQLLVYLMTGNKQGPCQPFGQENERWINCLDRVRVLLEKAWALPGIFWPFEEEREPKEGLTQEVWQLRKARLDDPRMYDTLARGFRLGTLPRYSSDTVAYGQELDEDIPPYPSKKHFWNREWMH